MDAARHLTVAEAARRLGVHPLTIRRAYYRRQLAVVRVGRAIRINPTALDRWVQTGGRTGVARG